MTEYDHDHCFRCGKEIDVDEVFNVGNEDESRTFCPECFYDFYGEHLGDCPTDLKPGCLICDAKRGGEKWISFGQKY